MHTCTHTQLVGLREYYMTGGQRWTYTSVYYQAVIPVQSPLDSLLAVESLIRPYFEAYLHPQQL